MKNTQEFNSVRIIASLATIMSLVFLILYVIYPSHFDSLKYLASVAAGAAVTLMIGMTSRTLYSHPSSLVISILGLPSSGKTVYLSVLFNELEVEDIPRLQFSRYGHETIEKVEKNISSLHRGEWLPATQESELTVYRAKALYRKNFIPKQYKIEISDYAGELLGELIPEDDHWLHKTKYFKTAVESDAVIMAVDCSLLMNYEKENSRSSMQSHLVAALQVLLEEKGVDIHKKLNAPLALVYMKSDLFGNDPDKWLELREKMQRLEAICKKRCKNFNTFFVSSVGTLKNGLPPTELRPYNVVKPLEWILRNIKP